MLNNSFFFNDEDERGIRWQTRIDNYKLNYLILFQVIFNIDISLLY